MDPVRKRGAEDPVAGGRGKPRAEIASQRVTVTVGDHSITISSDDEAHGEESLDVQTFQEQQTWQPADIHKALTSLASQAAPTKRVNCAMGRHRSPAIAILYLMWKTGQPLLTVWRAVVVAYAQAGATLDVDKIRPTLGALFGEGLTGRRLRSSSGGAGDQADGWGPLALLRANQLPSLFPKG